MCAPLETYDPFLSPAWRWDAAGSILCGEPVDVDHDDPLIRAAVALRPRTELDWVSVPDPVDARILAATKAKRTQR